MKILGVKSLVFPEVKVIRYQRFNDNRGFFTEIYRKNDFQANPELSFLKGAEFTQANVSFSHKNTVRGLHFQWHPYMDKLVRVIAGRMYDLFLDIRKNSPTFGKISAYEMHAEPSMDYNEWIWIPVGFAHGSIFPEETHIEYFCTAEYHPQTEASISPYAPDIDWSLCDPSIKDKLYGLLNNTLLISEKDKNGYTFAGWNENPDSENFRYQAS